MLVVDGWTEKGHLRETDLPFEGFLEALCRVSTLKALPTDREIAMSGCSDAGRYMVWLRVQDEEAYHALLAERAGGWGDELRQPLARCLAHTIAIIFREMEEERKSGGRPSEVVGLTDKEIAHWFTMNEQKLGLFSLSNPGAGKQVR